MIRVQNVLDEKQKQDVFTDPENHIDESIDLVLDKVYGENNSDPIMVMVGKEDLHQGVNQAYYLLLEDGDCEVARIMSTSNDISVNYAFALTLARQFAEEL